MANQTNAASGGYVRLFKAPEVLGVSLATVNRWIKSGKLPAPIKLSDRVTAFRSDELAAWLEAQPKRQAHA